MNYRALAIIVFMLVQTGCDKPTNQEENPAINETLLSELRDMQEFDQYTSGVPQGEYEGDWPAWMQYRDSTSRVMKVRLEEILDVHGYPGFDQVGEEGSNYYWNMVQHCDFDPDFQMRVLEKLKVEVEKSNANPINMGYLTDRANLNLGKKQVYGTQVSYNTSLGQAYSKPVEDSLNVNKRRKALGMQPLEEYLNGLSVMHFDMSKAHYDEIGLAAPTLYEIPADY